MIGCEDMLNTLGVSTIRKNGQNQGGRFGFAFRNHQGRTSEAITALHIWANGSFRPLRVRLIRGKAELLRTIHIAKTLGVQVCFGCGRFKVGQGGGK